MTPGAGADPRLFARQRHAGRGALHHLLLVLPVLFEPELADIPGLRLRPSHRSRRFCAQVPAASAPSHDDSARLAPKKKNCEKKRKRNQRKREKDANLLRPSLFCMRYDAFASRRKSFAFLSFEAIETQLFCVCCVYFDVCLCLWRLF